MKPSGIKILILSLGFSANAIAGVATDESCEKEAPEQGQAEGKNSGQGDGGSGS